MASKAKWRRLRKGEIIRKNDEFACWEVTNCAGQKVMTSEIYRRRVK